MATTQNFGLHLTGISAEDTSITFREWRTRINGEGMDTNMQIIDAAMQEIKEATGSGVQTVNDKSPDAAKNITLTADDVGARSSTWTPSSQDVGAYPIGGLIKKDVNIAVANWTGTGPYTYVINDPRFTARHEILIGNFSEATRYNYTAAINGTGASGKMTLTTTAKPTGTLDGYIWFTEVIE